MGRVRDRASRPPEAVASTHRGAHASALESELQGSCHCGNRVLRVPWTALPPLVVMLRVVDPNLERAVRRLFVRD
jgi:hypothetical protein